MLTRQCAMSRETSAPLPYVDAMKRLSQIARFVVAAALGTSGIAQTLLNPKALAPTVTSFGGMRVTLNRGRLEASVNAAQRWRYGTQIIAQTASKKTVLALERSGRVVGLNAEDGRVLRSTVTGLKPHAGGVAKLTNTTSGIVLASVTSDSMSSSPVIVALRVADGHVLWQKADVCGSNGPAVVAAGLVVWDFTCTGAFTRTELRAFSLQRGKLIWERQALHYGALKRGFLHILGLTADANVAKVERLELASGRGTTRTYRLNTRPSCGQLDSVVDKRFDNGTLVFFGRDDCGDLEVRIPLR
jgi:PQQ-like domain